MQLKCSKTSSWQRSVHAEMHRLHKSRRFSLLFTVNKTTFSFLSLFFCCVFVRCVDQQSRKVVDVLYKIFNLLTRCRPATHKYTKGVHFSTNFLILWRAHFTFRSVSFSLFTFDFDFIPWHERKSFKVPMSKKWKTEIHKRFFQWEWLLKAK